MRPSKEIILKLSTLAFLIYLIDGLELIGVAIQLLVTTWLTWTLLRNTYLTKQTWYTYISVVIDAAVLCLMCISTIISPAPSSIIYTMGLLTMIKHLLNQREFGAEIANALTDF